MLRPGTAPGRTQVDWLEPELVSERIAELRKEEGALEDALAGLGAERQEAEDEELTRHLNRLPDLTNALNQGGRFPQRNRHRIPCRASRGRACQRQS